MRNLPSRSGVVGYKWRHIRQRRVWLAPCTGQKARAGVIIVITGGVGGAKVSTNRWYVASLVAPGGVGGAKGAEEHVQAVPGGP